MNEFARLVTGYQDPRRNGHDPAAQVGAPTPLGMITRGSLLKGLQLRLEHGTTVEDMRVGRFVVIEGEENRFFCLVTDMELGATNEHALLDPPSRAHPLIAEMLEDIATFGAVSLQPMLMLPRIHELAPAADTNGVERTGHLEPVRTIPVHFSPVYDATEDDFASVFGKEDDRHFAIGQPLNMDIPVCLDLERIAERSNGVFGKSGTGKSFLTRLLLAGMISRDIASALVFDMHSEYGWETQSEEGLGQRRVLPGLRRLFGSKVHVYTIDPESSRARGVKVDGELEIGLNQIEIEDIALLADELDFTGAMLDTCYLLRSMWGEGWLRELLDTQPAALENVAQGVGGHRGSLAAVYRKLSQLRGLGFVKDHLPSGASKLHELIGWLERGQHVVLEFGRYRRPLVYMLVANIITRHIYDLWVQKTERYLLTKRAADEPRRLMLVIEEAHKFLNPKVAKSTSFGTIAREMRKYYVTLLVVDQRPSGIDPEVASQLGTRLTALLTEENDIKAVFTGVSGSEHLRAVLASLDTKKQALILGHAVPMPVVVRTREYDEAFFAAVSPREAQRQEARVSGEPQRDPLADLFE
ncbi:MAG TPA: ATP-binding protein [Chloroflexota bacterium]|nr:ATP-binding protein [Chloroflexota bacterium]